MINNYENTKKIKAAIISLFLLTTIFSFISSADEKKDDSIIMLFECKWCGCDLDECQMASG